MHLAAAPSLDARVAELERANDRLRRTNARMARERLGIADSAAAVAVERLRREDEARRLERLREPEPLSLPVRAWGSFKRKLAWLVPHGLIVLQQRMSHGTAETEPPE